MGMKLTQASTAASNLAVSHLSHCAALFLSMTWVPMSAPAIPRSLFIICRRICSLELTVASSDLQTSRRWKSL